MMDRTTLLRHLRTHKKTIAVLVVWLGLFYLSVKLESFPLFWHIWLTFLLRIEFGVVFVLLSMFVFIWRSLGARTDGPSAYSVFNPNVSSLPGMNLAIENFL